MEKQTLRPVSGRLIGWTIFLLLWGSATIIFAVLRSNAIAAALTSGVRPVSLFDARYVDHPWSSYLHIGLGSLFMILGPFQFSTAMRGRWLSFHRTSGRIFIVSGLLVGMSALYLALWLPAYGGLLTLSATLVFTPIFLYALVRAYADVRQRRIQSHREWMIRAYALGLAVSTIRFYIAILDPLTPYTFEQLFGPSFWLAFVTHFAIAEWWIRRKRAR